MKQYLASLHFYFARGGGAVQLAGSIIENAHGLHWNTFRSAANANHVASFIICPHRAGHFYERCFSAYL